MHITRVVTIFQDSTSGLVYSLNGCRVWVRQDFIHVGKFTSGDYREYMDDTRDDELCELAEAIGRHDSGQHKIDPDNTNIQTFLKVTKCLS